jgi:Bacterial Ig-like domain (group 2)
VLIVISTISCGGNGSSGTSSPTAPTVAAAPAPVVRSISLSRSSLQLVVGNSESLSASAIYSDNSSRAISPTWSSSNTAVAVVDSSGTVRALSGGSATITATSSGVSSSLVVTSMPNYAGRWFGAYRFVTCSAPFRWGSSYCSGLPGTIFNVELTLTMSGSQVAGFIRLGSYTGPVSGTIVSDGTLILQGGYSVAASGGLSYSEVINNWRTVTTNGTTMTGGWQTTGYLTNERETAFKEYQMLSVIKS